jgi:hypothetical protein
MAFKRRLVFYAWADTNENHPFQRVTGAEVLAGLAADEVVLDHGDDYLTAVEVVDPGGAERPTRLVLHALHGPGSRPSEWGPGEGMRSIRIGRGRYTAFSSHVVLWKDKIAALDTHANAPGLGRLSTYFMRQATERVAFRPLFEQGTADRLRDLDGIRGVEFSIHEPHKIQRARARGMLGSVLPQRHFPSIYVSAGMSRKEPEDAYLDDELAEEIFALADEAEQFFDRLMIKGRSNTEKTATGKKKTVEVNLLSERLQIEDSLEEARQNPSMPAQEAVFSALDSARHELQRGSKLAAAVEARLALDAAD